MPVPLVAVTPNEFSYIPPTGWKPPTVDVDMNALWAYVREQIIANPKWVALKTSIEQIGWRTDPTEPAASPTLKEVGEEYYKRKTDLSEKEANKAESTWGDFMRNTRVQTLRELTAEAIAKWGNKVRAEGLALKTIGHRFNRIKTILNHFRSTGRVLADVRHALDCCAVLKAPEAVSLDPHPIARADFHKLLDAAEGEGKAMLLAGMNLCMYPIDLSRLRWTDLDLARGVYHAPSRMSAKWTSFATFRFRRLPPQYGPASATLGDMSLLDAVITLVLRRRVLRLSSTSRDPADAPASLCKSASILDACDPAWPRPRADRPRSRHLLLD